MDMYTRLYETTGGKIQESKILYYYWIWGYENGMRVIKQVETELFVHGERIECVDPTKSTRTLGVHINPSLSWDDQFEVMRKKLYISITKMMNTDVNAYQAAVYYNVYMIKSVFFGCGIIELNEQQERELRRIYKEPLLLKLGLSRKFPRDVLYSRKSALGVGIMKPSTIIDILKAKLYLGNARRKGVTYEAIKLQEEYLKVEAGCEINIPYNPQE